MSRGTRPGPRGGMPCLCLCPDTLSAVLAFLGGGGGVDHRHFYATRGRDVERKIRAALAFMARGTDAVPRVWRRFRPPPHLRAHAAGALETHDLGVGDAVVCWDAQGALCPAYVVDDRGRGPARRLRVKFVGWGAAFREWKTAAELVAWRGHWPAREVVAPPSPFHFTQYYWATTPRGHAGPYLDRGARTGRSLGVPGWSVFARAMWDPVPYPDTEADFRATVRARPLGAGATVRRAPLNGPRAGRSRA